MDDFDLRKRHIYGTLLLDLARRIGLFWVRDQAELPYWTASAPFRTLLHWWMEANGCQLLHAAAVGHQDGALLITGKGGVGKSTTALTCLEAGMQLISDDYLVVKLRELTYGQKVACVLRCPDPGCGKPMDLSFDSSRLDFEGAPVERRFFTEDIAAGDVDGPARPLRVEFRTSRNPYKGTGASEAYARRKQAAR